MSDFTTLNVNYNKGTDATPDWTGTALAFGGSGGANELRFTPSTGMTTTTASATTPFLTKPASGVLAAAQLWACTADATCLQVTPYDGSNTNGRVLRWNWDALGTFASAPQFSAFTDNTHGTPSPGTQGSGGLINGSADTSNTSYVKANAYGSGASASGSVQQTPAAGAAGTTLAATSGTAGALSPAASAWLATWQSLQGWTQYIAAGVIPQATFAALWYWTVAVYIGANITAATYAFVFTFQYTFS